ncbi:MAG TPA: hypothetical protein VGH33_07145 [Isosphaeraceae bacterium]
MSLMAPVLGSPVRPDYHVNRASPRRPDAAHTNFLMVPSGDRQIRVGLATERAEFEQAFRLLATRYEERGYDAGGSGEFRFTPSHALPRTVTFVAKDGDRVVATLSMVPDNATLGLPMESLYADEVGALRCEGRRLAEVISLADDGLGPREFLRVFLAMIRVMFQYHVRNGGDSWVITVNPRHRGFYRKVLGFVPLGPRRAYSAVGGHPAEAYLLDVDLMRENAPAKHREIFGEALPLPVLTARARPADHAHYFGARSSQADYMTILRVLAACDERRREARGIGHAKEPDARGGRGTPPRPRPRAAIAPAG